MTCFRILVFLIINDSVNFQNQWSQVQFATISPTYPHLDMSFSNKESLLAIHPKYFEYVKSEVVRTFKYHDSTDLILLVSIDPSLC